MKKYRLASPLPHRYGRWEYRVQADGSICLCDFHGNRPVLQIPRSLMGRPVTALGRSFSGPRFMQLLIIPDTVHTIGPQAGACQEELTAVVIPPSVTHIDDTAFADHLDNEDFTLFVTEGSCTHVFAEEKGFRYELDTLPEVEDSETAITCGPWLYGLVDGDAIIREYNGTDATVEVPAEIDGCPVAGVSSCCFHGNDFLEELMIPEGVRYIHPFALAECESLRRVQLPDSLQHIGAGCFSGCRRLEEVNLPPLLDEISASCFHGCASLRSITLPPQVRLIELLAFSCCTSLEEICLSPVLETVIGSAFLRCPNLRRPELPATLDAKSRALFAALPHPGSVH